MARSVPLLVIPSRADAERDAVAAAWMNRGWEVLRLDRFWEPPALDPQRVKVYGNDVFCLTLAQKLGLDLVSPADDLLAKLDERWLKRQLCIRSLAQTAVREFPTFVKPVVPKAFRASVYADAAELESETTGLTSDTLVFVSEPVTIEAEARCLVLAGRVLSVALYEGSGNGGQASDFAGDFVRNQAGKLPVTLALDVGLIEGRGWAVVEANACWGAGLNGCDPEAMVDCLVAAACPAAPA